MHSPTTRSQSVCVGVCVCVRLRLLLFTYEKRKTEEFGIQALSDKRKVIFSGSNPFIVGKRADNALGRYYRFSSVKRIVSEKGKCATVCAGLSSRRIYHLENRRNETKRGVISVVKTIEKGAAVCVSFDWQFVRKVQY